MKGFTLTEILIVIGISLILAVAAIPIYGNLQVQSQLNENTSQIIQVVRTARERSVAGYNNAQHGVYFEINTLGNDKYILYQGSTYASRSSAYDREIILDSALNLSVTDFVLTGGKDVDVNFSKGLSVPDNRGTMTLTHDVSGSSQIVINTYGAVEEN